VALELELLLGREPGVDVDLLLQHAKPVPDPDDLLEERLDRDLLALHVGLARHELEGPARPPRRQLELDVDPAVLAEHVAPGLADATELGIAAPLLRVEAVVAKGDAPRVAAPENDHVLPRLVADDATHAELQVPDDAADAVARRRRLRRSGLRGHRRSSCPV